MENSGKKSKKNRKTTQQSYNSTETGRNNTDPQPEEEIRELTEAEKQQNKKKAPAVPNSNSVEPLSSIEPRVIADRQREFRMQNQPSISTLSRNLEPTSRRKSGTVSESDFIVPAQWKPAKKVLEIESSEGEKSSEEEEFRKKGPRKTKTVMPVRKQKLSSNWKSNKGEVKVVRSMLTPTTFEGGSDEDPKS